MKTGESTGGRPPYVLEKEDIQLAKELAEEGLSLVNIAKALNIADSTLDQLRERNADFSSAIKKGRALEYISCNKNLKSGNLVPAAYIFFAKTKWKHFYPREIRKDEELENNKLTIELVDKMS